MSFRGFWIYVIDMGIVTLTIDGQEINFKVKNVNSIGFYDRLTRAHYDINIYLAMVVEEPRLSATEWYEKVPIVYKNKIVEAIQKYVDDNYVQPL